MRSGSSGGVRSSRTFFRLLNDASGPEIVDCWVYTATSCRNTHGNKYCGGLTGPLLLLSSQEKEGGEARYLFQWVLRSEGAV